MIEIFHPGKGRNVQIKNMRVMVHVTPDEHGVFGPEKYVQFTLVGARTEYEDFILLNDFKLHNPGTPVA